MEESLINVVKSKDEIEEEKKKKAIERWGSKNEDFYLRSNIFSKIFFFWAFRVIRLANNVPLKSEFLGKMEGTNLSKVYIKDIENIWENKGYKYLKKLALLKASLRANLGSIIIMIILSLFVNALEFLSVFLFRIYIKSYQSDYEPIYEFLTQLNVGIIFISVKVLSTFVNRQTNIYQNILGYKTGIELNCLIFNKVLRSSPASNKEKSSEGEIINFLQVDSSKLSMVMTFGPAIFTIPVQIVVYTLMLFEFMGISFIFGFCALLIFLGLNFFIQNKYRVLQKDMLKRKDARMKVTTETFNNLKVLKLYGWEEEFLRRIEDSRNEELNVYKKIFFYSNINLTLLWFAPIAVSICSIGAYQYLTAEMKIEDIFTCLTIFNSIQEPIRTLPWIINNLLELIVSMKRIEKFLSQEEIDNNKMKVNDEETVAKGISVKIDHGNFSWGSVEVDKKKQKQKEKEKEATIGKETIITNNQNVITTTEAISDQENKSLITINNKTDASNSDVNEDIKISIVKPEPLLPNENDNESRTILKDINLEIKKGEFVCVIGEVGSGKSSLLQAILNNMLPVTTNINNEQVNPNLIVNGSISYVSQISWIQNDTVKNNILFNSPMDQAKYDYILDICELRPDLQVLVGGDMTEIGEKGINLSGGQKARISIARALYADNDIFLFDDPISALDAHVGQNIMKNCIINHLRSKTRILVTHALQYLNNADRIIYMKEGEIYWQGSYEEITTQDFYQDIKMKMNKEVNNENDMTKQKSEEEDIIDPKEKETEEKSKDVKRITKDEDKEEGQVKTEVFVTYIRYMGGFFIFSVVMCVMAIWQVLKGGSDLWLTYWTQHQSKEDNFNYFLIYALLGSSSAIFVFFRTCTITSSSIKCAKRLHSEMIEKLVHAPINLFHDTIPKGQILNRLSKDITNIDAYTMFMYSSLFSFFFALLGAIVICSIKEPRCLIFIPFIFIIGWTVQRFYRSASRDLSRLDGTTRSPIINLLAETIPGAMIIRAFRKETLFVDKFHERADDYLKIRYIASGASQWFGLILDLLSVSFLLFLIVFTILFNDYYTSQDIGIMLTYSLSLQDNLFKLLLFFSNFENCMVSMERCLKYTTIPVEAPYYQKIDEELNDWPQTGEIRLENYSVKYRPETEVVLKDLTFGVKPGEKIGVVGRTGSGKSTLCLALFRILEPLNGKIIIDNIDVSLIGLKKLRTSLTIIPQDPNLMQGTLKYNIDPLNLYSDEEVKVVMQMIGFWYICENNQKGLEQPIAESGSNLSVGEKQLICITRAILRKSKIVVMDEATANIDMRTEEIIQKAINEILKHSTVITIAHRIKTIIHYDKILVLADGEIVEYDSPRELIENKKGLFYQLYTKSTL